MKTKYSVVIAYILVLLALAGYTLYSCFKFYLQGIFEHTLVVYFFVWLLLVSGIILVWYKTRGKISPSVFLLSLSVLFSLLIAELFLRAMHRNESSIEARSGIYVSPYHSTCLSLFYEYGPNFTFYLESPEFKYKRVTNSLGLTGPEPAMQKDSGEYRVLAMGDSFTDGDGADYDSSYVSFLKRMVSAKYPNRKFDFINAGVCGSDPFFNYIALEKKLLKYHPDLVLVNISSGDLEADAIVRGGMERFANGQKAEYRKGPRWEPLYAVSFLFRLLAQNFGGVDLLLLTPQDYIEQKPYLDSIATDLMKRFDRLGAENSFQTVFMLRPFLWEIKQSGYTYNFEPLQKSAKGLKHLQWFDMMPGYQQLIQSSGKQADNFFWPQNGHHNAAGYEVMAKVALQCTEPILNPVKAATISK